MHIYTSPHVANGGTGTETVSTLPEDPFLSSLAEGLSTGYVKPVLSRKAVLNRRYASYRPAREVIAVRSR